METYKDFVGELTAIYRRTEKPSVTVNSSAAAEEFLRPYFDEIMDDHEEFKVLHLNRSGGVVNVDQVSSGTDRGTLVPIKDIVRNALLIKCHGLILSHNHPSGNLRPSGADERITEKIKEAAGYFEINVLDHIVLTREGYFSFADEGLL